MRISPISPRSFTRRRFLAATLAAAPSVLLSTRGLLRGDEAKRVATSKARGQTLLLTRQLIQNTSDGPPKPTIVEKLAEVFSSNNVRDSMLEDALKSDFHFIILEGGKIERTYEIDPNSGDKVEIKKQEVTQDILDSGVFKQIDPSKSAENYGFWHYRRPLSGKPVLIHKDDYFFVNRWNRLHTEDKSSYYEIQGNCDFVHKVVFLRSGIIGEEPHIPIHELGHVREASIKILYPNVYPRIFEESRRVLSIAISRNLFMKSMARIVWDEDRTSRVSKARKESLRMELLAELFRIYHSPEQEELKKTNPWGYNLVLHLINPNG